MSRILDLAEAVAAALAAYSAEVLFIPEFDLKGTKETRVIVVPAGTEFRALSRSLHDERPCVHVGVLKRAENLHCEMHRFAYFKFALLFDIFLEGYALDIFHYDILECFAVAYIVNPNNVGVRKHGYGF